MFAGYEQGEQRDDLNPILRTGGHHGRDHQHHDHDFHHQARREDAGRQEAGRS
jgi:hypothetical protein